MDETELCAYISGYYDGIKNASYNYDRFQHYSSVYFMGYLDARGDGKNQIPIFNHAAIFHGREELGFKMLFVRDVINEYQSEGIYMPLPDGFPHRGQFFQAYRLETLTEAKRTWRSI